MERSLDMIVLLPQRQTLGSETYRRDNHYTITFFTGQTDSVEGAGKSKNKELSLSIQLLRKTVIIKNNYVL